MSPEELRDQLLVAGISSRVKRGEVVLQTCPVCGNAKWNAELNPERGIWSCWAHGSGGRLDELLNSLLGGDQFKLQVRGRRLSSRREIPAAPPDGFARYSASEVPSAVQHLRKQRGLGTDEIRVYELTVCMEEGHSLYGRIVLPLHEYWTQKLVGYVGRAYAGERPKYVTTAPSREITGHRVRDPHAPIVMVEGPFDGINTHRAGFHAAVLQGISAERAEEFAARTDPEAPLVLMLDGEAVDQARRLSARISAVRPLHVVSLPPGIDPGALHPKAIRAVVERRIK